MLFIDFRKAFDLVDAQLLLKKLFHYGFDDKSKRLIKNYFENRAQVIKIGNITSSEEINIFQWHAKSTTIKPTTWIRLPDPSIQSHHTDTGQWQSIDQITGTCKKNGKPVTFLFDTGSN